MYIEIAWTYWPAHSTSNQDNKSRWKNKTKTTYWTHAKLASVKLDYWHQVWSTLQFVLLKQIGRNCLTVTNTKFGWLCVMLLLWCGLTNSWCCVSLGTGLQKTIITEMTDLWDCTDTIKDQRFDANSSWSNTGMSTVTNTDHFCVTVYWTEGTNLKAFHTMTVLLIERLIIFSIFCCIYHISFHIKFHIIYSL